MSKSLHVLAVEPYFGGSHRAFLDGVVRYSRHRWTLITAPARHWKWRMRSAPLQLANEALLAVGESGPTDAIVCSDMLDLPCWLGLISRDHSPPARQLIDCPIATYFHENQWTYPQSPAARPDFHYGYTNLLTAIASQACWFNSTFHQTAFFDACESFIRRMPDSLSAHDMTSLRNKSQVIPPGFDPPVQRQQSPIDQTIRPLRIGWVSRWEHDKRPDRLVELLRELKSRQLQFELILLGDRTGSEVELNAIRKEFGDRIIVDEYAQTRDEYWAHLQQIDIVVSTADHEFFGIAVCEAIAAGAAPVLPNRLSYVELVPNNKRYETIGEAANLIGELQNPKRRQPAATMARASIDRFQAKHTVEQLDDAINQLQQR